MNATDPRAGRTWDLTESGGRWQRATGLEDALATRVQDQVAHLRRRGVVDRVIREAVIAAADTRTSVLAGPVLARQPSQPVVAVPARLVALTRTRHRGVLDEVTAATGWPVDRAAQELASELAEAPDAPVDMAVTTVLLAAWGEEFDAFASVLAVELEAGNDAVSRAKLTRAFQLWLVGRDPSPTQMLVALRAIVAAVREQHTVAAAA